MGETALIASMLLQAAQDARIVPARYRHKANRDTAQQKRADARRWIDAERTRPFSFLWCCDHCGIDPQKVRAWVRHGTGPARTGPTHADRAMEGAAGEKPQQASHGR